MAVLVFFSIGVDDQVGNVPGGVDEAHVLFRQPREGAEKGFKPLPVDDEDVRRGRLVHVLRGESVVVGTSCLRGKHEHDLAVRHVPGHIADKLIDGKGGCDDPLRNGGPGFGGQREGQQDEGGYEQAHGASFGKGTLLLLRKHLQIFLAA